MRASSMRDVRLLNNVENSGKKKMKVDGGKEYGDAIDGVKEESKRRIIKRRAIKRERKNG